MSLFVVTIAALVHPVVEIGELASNGEIQEPRAIRIDVRASSPDEAIRAVAEHLQDLVEGDYQKRDGCIR